MGRLAASAMASNRTYREEVLSAYLFDSLDEVREITADCIDRYNEIRPHDALGSLPLARYREHLLAGETDT
jgi:putative transposase